MGTRQRTATGRESDDPRPSLVWRALRLIPLRVAVVGLVVLVVVGSERFGGPFTREALVERLSGAATADAQRRESAELGEVHLTFDDGPTRSITPRLLDVLEEYDATVVFFPIGNQVGPGTDLLRRAASAGHRVGNHTWNHDSLVGITDEQFDATVGRTQDAVELATGQRPTCLRPPGGEIDQSSVVRAAATGLDVHRWDVDPQDWLRPGRDAIVDDVLDSVGDGDVVLFHDGGGAGQQTVDAVDEILERLDRRGYRFTAIPGC